MRHFAPEQLHDATRYIGGASQSRGFPEVEVLNALRNHVTAHYAFRNGAPRINLDSYVEK